MSSRIYRPQQPGDAQPIAWRPQNQAPQHQGLQNTSSRSQEQRPDANDLQKEIEARTTAAYQQGLAAGDAAASQREKARLDPIIASLNNVVAELSGIRKNFRMHAEADTVALAVAIARRVLNRELATDPEAILGLVKAAFQKCDARETQRLRISPQDSDALRDHRARLNLPPALEVIVDGTLVRGSAIFETSRGDLDSSVDTQLGEIERGLADVLRRRTA